MNFSFENATIQENTIDPNKPRVMKPGIYTVQTTELKSGTSETGKKSPYIDWTVTNKDKEILTHRFFTNSEVKEGGKISAWDITSSSFLQLVAATNTLEKEAARAKLTEIGSASTSAEQFTTKLSALVVGKSFYLKVNGEEVITGAGKKFTKSKFGNYNFAIPMTGDLGILGKIYIKALPTADTTSTTVDSDTLPF